MAKPEQFTTPKGTAIYPYLTQPDTKFKSDGEYRVKLRMPAGPDAQRLIDLIEEHREKAIDEARDNLKTPKEKKNMAIADPPYAEVEDDDGTPTGEYEFTFKQNAIIRPKDKPAIRVTIPLFDAKGKPMTPEYVGYGSTIKVAFVIVPYFTKQVGAGVTLRIRAVQVIDLKMGQKDAAAYGFGEEEGSCDADELSNGNGGAGDDVPWDADDGDPGPGDDDVPQDATDF